METNFDRGTAARRKRLPHGQRVIVTSEENSCGLRLGTRGTVVGVEFNKKVCGLTIGTRKVDDDYFWENWEEQFVQVDGEDRARQVRRWDMAPIDEWTPRTIRGVE